MGELPVVQVGMAVSEGDSDDLCSHYWWSALCHKRAGQSDHMMLWSALVKKPFN